jgi:hypothetical protein
MAATTFDRETTGRETTPLRPLDKNGADRPARDVSVADFAWVTRRIFENQLIVGRPSPTAR